MSLRTSPTSPLLGESTNANKEKSGPPRALPARFERRSSLFADNGSFLDDLSFSYYFHSQWTNQALHFVSLLAIFASLAVVLAFAWSPGGVPVIALVVLASYAIVLVYLEWVAGAAFALWFAGALAASRFLVQFGDAAWGTAVALLVVMPPMQLLGHVVVERRLPAFRPFEALVTTPLFLMVFALNGLGLGLYDKAVVAQIKSRSSKWANWKQRTFGKGGVVPATS